MRSYLRKEVHLFNTAAECRAKAAAFRTTSVCVQSPAAKERLYRLSVEWDNQAVAYDALG